MITAGASTQHLAARQPPLMAYARSVDGWELLGGLLAVYGWPFVRFILCYAFCTYSGSRKQLLLFQTITAEAAAGYEIRRRISIEKPQPRVRVHHTYHFITPSAAEAKVPIIASTP